MLLLLRHGVPAPGAYDVQKSYEMSQIQHKYMPPRTFVARIKHASFLSTTPRCLDKVDDGPASTNLRLEGKWMSSAVYTMGM
ncbi:sperm-tail PG-rich repeat-containing protein 2-like [Bubalus kerabau]|uniref:sperm-tail PG-rich repeat-containing protein 2-like n=1 Tax=Bubalus carabanensis TaxID=3119969 RepID=UPI000572E410|nr:sperm-tail PG-rich repeat-containing protein 2-like [Bubalus carabanensis]